jgi:hypothetical protein
MTILATTFAAVAAGEVKADVGATNYYAASEAEEAAATAREALARLPAEGRLSDIKDERLRRAVQLAYRAIFELAENSSSVKVAALAYRFEQAFADVRREMARDNLKTCTENCQAGDGMPCEKDCRSAHRKFCGCRMIVFGCLVTECIF